MASEEPLYNFLDSKVKHTVEMPSGYNWDTYDYVVISLYSIYNKNIALQTSGYSSDSDPGVIWDIDLVIPDVNGDIAYMKIDQANVEDVIGPLVWVIRAREGDTDFEDSFYDTGDKIRALSLEGL